MLSYKSTADIKVPKTLIEQVLGQDDAVRVMRKAALQRRHVLLIGEPGTGKCVGKDTLIQLSDGTIRTAAELYAELEQRPRYAPGVNPDLSLAHARLVKAQRTVDDSVTLTTNTGKRITVSRAHSFLAYTQQGPAWKHADELSEGDVIAGVRRMESAGATQCLRHLSRCHKPTRSHSNVKTIDMPSSMDEAFAEFCGLLWSEGYIARKRSITFTNNDEVLIGRFVALAESLFGLYAVVSSRQTAKVAVIESSTLANNLILLGWGVKLPDELMRSPESVIRAFLRAYFDGDGSATKRSFEVTTKNPLVAMQLQSLLLRFGVSCILRKGYKRATNSTMAPKEYTTLMVYDCSNLMRLREIGFRIERKMQRLNQLCMRAPQSNIDKLPHLGAVLFVLKQKLGLTSDEIVIEAHQWQRYLQGSRTPTRQTVVKVVRAFAHRFVALKQLRPTLLTDGSIDTVGLLSEIGVSNAALEKRFGVSATDHHPALAQYAFDLIGECITEEIESKIISLFQLVDADVQWERITSVQEAGMQELYDFEADQTHTFIANCLIVHNSMLGVALAELLPKEKLKDVLAFPNPNDENQPLIRVMNAGQGREFIRRAKLQSLGAFRNQTIIMFLLLLLSMIAPWIGFAHYRAEFGNTAGAIMFAAFFLGGMLFLAAFVLFINVGRKMVAPKVQVPKVIVDNYQKKTAAFHDATGAHAGALLGDVLHDPFQSGGLGTPAHERVVAGMIHKAHMGVLFIDEIATLQPVTQQELLTALQEGKYAITGQSERSAGAMVRTEPVPCNFILVAAGNMETIKHMHPALRSRIRGYGYEVFMAETIEDTEENRDRIAVFVAQEVTKDKRIPHFTKDAVDEIVQLARRMANRKGHLTLRFRELGGLIRAAGDLAVEDKAKLVDRSHVRRGKSVARTLEHQLADRYIERKKEYEIIVTSGKAIGRVNGLAVIGTAEANSGIILPIEAAVTPGGKQPEFIATGQLGKIAKEAIKNVSAIVKRYFGEDIRETRDVYVQFLQSYEGVEGDSASIAVATAIISALKELPVKQEYAMTGSLSVRGEVLPVGGVSSKVEAAIDAGIRKIIVPQSNLKDIVVDAEKLKRVQIIPVTQMSQVLKEALDWRGNKAAYKRILSA